MSTKSISMLDPAILVPALRDAVIKLDPRQLIRNPVIFVTEIVAVLVSVLFAQDLMGAGDAPAFSGQIALWLWFTVLFATFAEAVAEGRGKAQADALRRARGRIVNVSSIGGRVGLPLVGAYNASKFGLEGLSDSLRRELRPLGVDVILIEPGGVKTPIWNKAEDLADEMLEDVPSEAERLYGRTIAAVRTGTQRIARETGIEPSEVAEAIAADDVSAGMAPAELETPAAPPEPSWPSAERTESQRPVPMPSGYGPSAGTTSGATTSPWTRPRMAAGSSSLPSSTSTRESVMRSRWSAASRQTMWSPHSSTCSACMESRHSSVATTDRSSSRMRSGRGWPPPA